MSKYIKSLQKQSQN